MSECWKCKFTDHLDPTPASRQLAEALTAGETDKLNALRKLTAIRYTIAEDGNPILSYGTDMKQFGQFECWESPDQAIQSRMADCDGGSFLVCSMLMGLPDHLRPEDCMVVVGVSRLTPGGVLPIIGEFTDEYHAWAEVLINGRWYISDWVSNIVAPKPNIHFKPLFAVCPWGIGVYKKGLL